MGLCDLRGGRSLKAEGQNKQRQGRACGKGEAGLGGRRCPGSQDHAGWDPGGKGAREDPHGAWSPARLGVLPTGPGAAVGAWAAGFWPGCRRGLVNSLSAFQRAAPSLPLERTRWGSSALATRQMPSPAPHRCVPHPSPHSKMAVFMTVDFRWLSTATSSGKACRFPGVGGGGVLGPRTRNTLTSHFSEVWQSRWGKEQAGHARANRRSSRGHFHARAQVWGFFPHLQTREQTSWA